MPVIMIVLQIGPTYQTCIYFYAFEEPASVKRLVQMHQKLPLGQRTAHTGYRDNGQQTGSYMISLYSSYTLYSSRYTFSNAK